MGGYFSTRWNVVPTRRDTDPLLKLDVCWLKRIGALQPGALAFPALTDGRGEPAGSITTRMNRAGDCLNLKYQTGAPGDADWAPHTLQVWLETTPCTFGGERVWFRCPHCQSRRAVLFSAGGIFACRACHNLAYASTRLDDMDRNYERIRKLHRKLKAPAGTDAWDFPPKPKGMHWKTYRRLASELEDEIWYRDRILEAKLRQLTDSVDRLLSQPGYAEYLPE